MTESATPASDFDGTVAFLGAGVMGGAVLSGLLAGGLPTERAIATDPSEQTRARWEERGVRAISDNVEAVRDADVVFLAVKPYAAAGVLDEVAAELKDGTLVVSIAAGVTIDTLEEHAGEGVPVVRVMPNTPALIREGMFLISAGRHCTQEQVDLVESLLTLCGRTEVVEEKQQNVGTALSGSGPAYLFYVADALVEAAVLEGMTRPVATRLVEQTLYGSAALLREGDTPASILREQVTSPGGSTAVALRALDAGAVRHHLGEAISTATRRNEELGG